MRVEPLGDQCFLLRDLDSPAFVLADELNRMSVPWFVEAAPAFETVGLYVRGEVDWAWVHEVAQGCPSEGSPGRLHEIPVCYELGRDLSEIAALTSLDEDEVVTLHTSVAYSCRAIGFSPGFPYLGDLPPPLQGVPRLAEPRLRTEPGSVALTGLCTGIYPQETPGGWRILGETPLVIADPDRGFFPICAGDRVQFRRIGMEEFEMRLGEHL
ncbi:MAG: allophanate hydrolase subunit 1 [Fimbriimonas ginsengisoli]|uniref:Allophanate hydrolase subunit 1 n=1 Tax=Fimbriimonas ginsengisoli TaxID=1005039 RepID=A0A931LW43_FIMGI|nr:allophanate hydrolase subunit 1 [Fimbriimonas ginsengisoli]